MRAVFHYVFSVAILSLYGGQVCPFIDTLKTSQWFGLNFVVLGITFVLRYFLMDRWVVRVSQGFQVRRQFFLELLPFFLASLVIISYNRAFFEFPLLMSGSKIVIGSLALGFFAATDLALERERKIFFELSRSGIELHVGDRYFPLTGKFSLFASVTILFVTAVSLLVIFRDFFELDGIARSDLWVLRKVILKELTFIGGVFLVEIINLIFSFTRNLKLFFVNENSTLTSVADGNLESRAIVSSNDEFGVMAKYTNLMIGNLRARTHELQVTQDVTILTLASLAETRDNETGAHILRTQRYVKSLAENLKTHPKFRDFLDPKTIDLLYKSAPLHDIGKVGVRDAVLLKPGRLSPEEFEEIKKHPVYGRNSLREAERILGENSFMRIAKEMAHTHHEQWDGSGYPEGLRGLDIPLSGRLMALADVYDALISKRIYKENFSHEKTRGIILDGKGKHFDPDIVEAFLAVETEFIRIAAEFADGKEIHAFS